MIDAGLITRIARSRASHLAGVTTGVTAGVTAGGLLSAQELKDFLTAMRRAKKKAPVPKALLDDVPDAHRDVIEARLKKITAKDLPRIINMKVPFNDLVREYHDRFHPFSLLTEVSDYDALVTDEWRKVTQGKTDSDSMNTIFLCLAAGLRPKPAISVAEAKAAIKAIRTDGAAIKSVPAFIERSAPHQMIDGLLSLWEDEFLPEMIEQLILDDADGAFDAVLRILAQHCHITAPRRKK